MTKILDMDTFVNCWREFTEKLGKGPNANILEMYNASSYEWTKFIIGDKRSLNSGSPFGEFFKETFGNNYIYRSEDGSVDMSFYQNEFVSGVQAITKLDTTKNVNQEILNNYPLTYDVLVEHENDVSRAYEEMYKLTYFRARLKVLITYNWNGDTKNDFHSTFKKLCSNFETIIKQTNKKFIENDETDYLLIVGQKIDRKLVWKYIGFSVGSMIKIVDSYVVTHEYKSSTNE